MVNKCAAFGCSIGLLTESKKRDTKVASFHFPFQNGELIERWRKFVNRKEWQPTKSSVLCENHFEDRYKLRGKRTTLKWDLNPVPTIHSELAAKRPSLLPNLNPIRKNPRIRNILPDQAPDFFQSDTIRSFKDIDAKHCPPGYQIKMNENNIVFYRLVFDPETDFPSIHECIKIDSDLHVQLIYNGNQLPLPKWLVIGLNAKLSRFSMLENLPAYIKTTVADHPSTILDELQKRQFYQSNGRPPYSSQLIRYALLLRYTSPQCYRMLLEKLPLPSLSTLSKIQQGGVDSMRAAKRLLEEGKISSEVVLMADEMYLRQETKFQGGDYVGSNENGELYKGVVVFMINGLKNSVPIVVRSCPEVSVSGYWLAQQLLECIRNLQQSGFSVRAIVTDNHPANVQAFQLLLNDHDGDKTHFFYAPASTNKTYIFFDTVHLIKNIRNNLLNCKKFVFPALAFEVCGKMICSPAGYICWSDLQRIYESDKKIEANMKKAPKLTFSSLHPGNNKQNVDLALAVFDEKTIAACRSYLPDRNDMAAFLEVIHTWWNIANSKALYTPNLLSNGIMAGDGKTKFYQEFADWLESWSTSHFSLTKQTMNALIRTLRSQAMLITDLIEGGFTCVLTRRLQSDPIENRFSQYRQMNGGNFLVSLQDVKNSERILVCRSLLRADIDFWKEETLQPAGEANVSLDFLREHESEIEDLCLNPGSAEVAYTIAGYVARKLMNRFECEKCEEMMTAGEDDKRMSMEYFNLLSRGGLTAPSSQLSEFVCSAFCIVEYVDKLVASTSVRKITEMALHAYAPKSSFACEIHLKNGYKFSIRTVVNIFYNNKQKLARDEVRKDSLRGFKKRQRTKE